MAGRRSAKCVAQRTVLSSQKRTWRMVEEAARSGLKGFRHARRRMAGIDEHDHLAGVDILQPLAQLVA